MLDIKKDILSFLNEKEDPVTVQGLIKGAGFHRNDRQYVKDLLLEMTREGLVVRKGNRYWVPDGPARGLEIKRGKSKAKNELVGRFTVTSVGYGFVDASGRGDWKVLEYAFNGAKHGDIVRANFVSRGRDGRITAEIQEILEYGVATVLGVFEKRQWGFSFTAFNDFKLNRRELFDWPEGEVRHGMVGRWNRRSDGKWAFGGMLGDITDPMIDEPITLAENGVIADFSAEVQQAVAQLDAGFDFKLGDRVDFRDQVVFTVDGADARDFDDALHFRHLDGGDVEVGVHIADVSEFVQPGSVLDEWASMQGNSTYYPHKAFPMLPEILSTELCSLKPGVPRYTTSVLAVISRDGVVESYTVRKGLIQSSFRLTYSQVYAMGVEKDEAVRKEFEGVVPSIDLALNLASKLRTRRVKAGGLNLDLTEMRMRLKEDMTLDEVYMTHQTDANRMIEAFMLLANECVAHHMEEYGIPFRVHEAPDQEKLEAYGTFLQTFGHTPPENLFLETGPALNKIIRMIHDAPNAQVLQTQLLRTLKMAEYSPENRGHFGLASTHYAHFTSPIRRYADLAVHQRLRVLLDQPDLGPEHFQDEDMEDICRHISKKERASMRAEQSFKNIKLLRRMQEEVGNEFEGLITEVKPYGFFVQVSEIYASGLVAVDDLDDDNYEFAPDMLALAGRRSGKWFRVGQSVKVLINRVDIVSRKLDLILVSGGEKAPSFPKVHGGHRGSRAGGRRDQGKASRGRGKRVAAGPEGRDNRGRKAGTRGKGRGRDEQASGRKKKVKRTLGKKGRGR